MALVVRRVEHDLGNQQRLDLDVVLRVAPVELADPGRGQRLRSPVDAGRGGEHPADLLPLAQGEQHRSSDVAQPAAAAFDSAEHQRPQFLDGTDGPPPTVAPTVTFLCW